MRKIVLIILILSLALCTLSAAFVPFHDSYNKNIFSSPARLIEVRERTPFGFEIEAKSAVDYLSFLASPSKSLSNASTYLYETLMKKDVTFWKENPALLEKIYAFDAPANLPQAGADGVDEVYVAQVKAYLEDSYANRFSVEQKAQAVLNAQQNSQLFNASNATKLNGDVLLHLSLFTRSIYDNGFGWQLISNIGLDGSDNMLSSASSLFSFDIRGNVGYAINIFSNRFTIGSSLETGLYAQNSLLNKNILNARFTGEAVNAFSENFKFGLGFALNFGAMYRHSDELAFTVDLNNIVNYRKFYDLTLTDFVDYNGFDEDANIYYMPMDISITALFDRGRYHLAVEFSDVLNQLFWVKETTYSYDFFAIPKVRFAYDINEKLKLNTSLQYSELSLGIEYGGLTATLSSSLNKLGFGIKVGYSF